MSEKKETVAYFVFEGEMTRMERTNHRLWILCILLLPDQGFLVEFQDKICILSAKDHDISDQVHW